MQFKQWLEDCGEDFARGNKGPFAKAKSKYIADDEEVPRTLRSKTGIIEPIHPEKLFGKMKKR
jgi:hypothetical protein